MKCPLCKEAIRSPRSKKLDLSTPRRQLLYHLWRSHWRVQCMCGWKPEYGGDYGAEAFLAHVCLNDSVERWLAEAS